jgi:hypothetical protein
MIYVAIVLNVIIASVMTAIACDRGEQTAIRVLATVSAVGNAVSLLYLAFFK